MTCWTPYSYLSYKAMRTVEDATATMFSTEVKYKKNHTHLLFIDFSSAFNCNQPHAHRLLSNFTAVFCLTHLNRSQRVHVNQESS